MYRLDHIAHRVKDRKKTADFFCKAFGYKIQQEFQLDFGDGTFADCLALSPPERTIENAPWTVETEHGIYYMSPELFVSDGSTNSIVGAWVEARNGIGGIHHIAFMVDSVEEKVKEWREKGYAEFSSENPIQCEDDPMVQIFTKPSLLTGVVYEFIKRGEHGFCRNNVMQLMKSSKD